MRTWSDPPVDSAFPPTMGELSFESGGSKLNGLMYVANGPGPHPTVVILHGYPGNERNLDLAQAMRRAGMNVLYFDYRGTWGSGGEFSIAHALEDVAKAVERARSEEWALAYRVDPGRVALVGHSLVDSSVRLRPPRTTASRASPSWPGPILGGSVRMHPPSQGWSPACISIWMRRAVQSTGMQAVASEIASRAKAWSVPSRAADLATRPLFLVAAARDEVAPKADHHDRVIEALRKADAERLTEVELTTTTCSLLIEWSWRVGS